MKQRHIQKLYHFVVLNIKTRRLSMIFGLSVNNHVLNPEAEQSVDTLVP
jgi:hypothetical protein